MEDKLKDLTSQIILAVKHLPNGITEFQGQQVMEAGDEDMLFETIEEALKQYGEYSTTVYKSTLQQQVEGLKRDWDGDGNTQYELGGEHALGKVIKIISDSIVH